MHPHALNSAPQRYGQKTKIWRSVPTFFRPTTGFRPGNFFKSLTPAVDYSTRSAQFAKRHRRTFIARLITVDAPSWKIRHNTSTEVEYQSSAWVR